MNNASISTDHHGDPEKAALYSVGAAAVIFINIMTIASYMLRKKSKRVIPDVFMLSMAVSAVITMSAVILILAYVRATGNEYFIGLKPLCYIQVYFGTMLRLTDVSTATAITIDRFLALYKPLAYRVNVQLLHGKVVCLFIWIVSALIAMLPLVGFGRVSMHMQSFCTADWTSDITYVVLSLAYPQFVIVLVCYIGIFRAISKLVDRQKTMRKSQSLSYQPTPDAVRRKNGIASVLPPSLSNRSLSSATETSTFYVNSVFEEEEDVSVKTSSTVHKHSELTPNMKKPHIPCDGENTNNKTTSTDSLEKDHKSNHLHHHHHIGIDKSRLRKISSEIVGIFRNRRSFKAKNRVSWFNVPEDAREESKINTINEVIPENGIVVEFTKNQKDNSNCFVKQSEESNTVNEEDSNSGYETKVTTSVNNTPRESIQLDITDKGNNKRFDSISDRLRSRFLKRTSSVTSIRTFRTESQHFAKVMGVVVFLFYVSWAPLAVSNFFLS